MNKIINIKNLTIQIDDDGSGRSVNEQAQDAINQINGVLQREPYGIGAQILPPDGDLNVEVSDSDNDEDDSFDKMERNWNRDL